MAIEALQMALAERRPQPGMIHHSDRGVQYACAEYLTLLAEHSIQPSMSRPGNPYDNAKAESFMKTLKHEQVEGHRWRDLDALRADLATFFETTYNRQRLHSSLGYQPPAEFELACAAQARLSRDGWGKGRLAPDPTPWHQQSKPVPSFSVSPEGCSPRDFLRFSSTPLPFPALAEPPNHNHSRHPSQPTVVVPRFSLGTTPLPSTTSKNKHIPRIPLHAHNAHGIVAVYSRPG